MPGRRPSRRSRLHPAHAAPRCGRPCVRHKRVPARGGRRVRWREHEMKRVWASGASAAQPSQRTCSTSGTASVSREGSKSPRRASSASARQPPCHAPSPSDGCNSCSTAATTSSAKVLGRREVMRPTANTCRWAGREVHHHAHTHSAAAGYERGAHEPPLAADQRTTVSVSRNPVSSMSTISSIAAGTSPVSPSSSMRASSEEPGAALDARIGASTSRPSAAARSAAVEMAAPPPPPTPTASRLPPSSAAPVAAVARISASFRARAAATPAADRLSSSDRWPR